MRNPDRLDSFYDELKKIHKKSFPDMRFGQLCSNFFSWLASEKKVDFFSFQKRDRWLGISENLLVLRKISGENGGRINWILEIFWVSW